MTVYSQIMEKGCTGHTTAILANGHQPTIPTTENDHATRRRVSWQVLPVSEFQTKIDYRKPEKDFHRILRASGQPYYSEVPLVGRYT